MQEENAKDDVRRIEKALLTLRKALWMQYSSMTKQEQQSLYPKKVVALDLLRAKVMQLQRSYDTEICYPIVCSAGKRIAKARSDRELQRAIREYKTQYLFGNGGQRGFCIEEELVALTEAFMGTGRLSKAAAHRYKKLFRKKYPQYKTKELEIRTN